MIDPQIARSAFDLRRLRRSFAGVSGLYVLGIPLLLLANIVLARAMSMAEFGAFGFAISTATVLAIPVSGGLPMLLTREVARYVRVESWSSYRGLVASAYQWVAATCLLTGVGALIWVALAGVAPQAQILIALLLVPFLGLAGIRNGILKGMGRPVLAEAPAQIMQPALMILGYLLLARFGLSSAVNALWWYLCVVALVFVCGSLIQLRVQPREVRDAPSELTDLPRWRRAILPFVLMSGAAVLGTQVAVLLLGTFGETEAVAQLRVAERGAQLVVFPLTFINTILGPFLVDSIASGNRAQLGRLARYSARLTVAVALPIALILLFFGRTLLGWTFGSPYEMKAYWPMVSLITAQVLSVALGSGGLLLVMSGNEKQALYALLISLAITGVLCFLLIDPFGATGAACGAAIGIVAAKVYVYAAVRRQLGISSGVF